MGIFDRNNPSRKKQTKGFSELNRRTYEASPMGRSQQRQSYQRQNLNNQQQEYQRNVTNHVRNSNVSSYSPNFNNVNSTSDYTRGSSAAKYASVRKQQLRNKKIKIFAIVFIAIILVIIACFTAFALNISNNLNQGMDKVDQLTPTQYANAPFYMVLMGVDSSEERKQDGGTDDDYRSDSIILARIDPVNKKVTLMSLHRDTEINMGEHGKQKLNAAHSLGGPNLVIKAVSELAGVPINHYAEINFDGFKAAVDDLGGVEVDIPMDIWDPMAGGSVPAGKQVLNGEQALIVCRARHAFDAFGDGDKYRAANQRVVLSAIAKKCLSSDILTIAKTVTDLSKYIKTDFALTDIIGLAQLMKDIDFEKDVYTAMEPTEGVYKDGVWYERVLEDEWREMMERMDKGLPPSKKTIIDPETGTIIAKSDDSSDNSSSDGKFHGSVAVRNGTTKDGLAADASNKISDLGFTTDVKNANSLDYTQTVIVYSNDNQLKAAQAIKDAIGCGNIVKNNNEYIFETDLLVVVGTDYNK